MIAFLQQNFTATAFFLFLIFNLGVGIYYGRGTKTVRDYALGGRNFSTAMLVATIVATGIGGGDLFITTKEIYQTGLFYTIGWLGVTVYLLMTAKIFVPRMGEFLGVVSVASAMGNIYGKKIRLLSAISGPLASVCYIAMQFKVLSAVLAYVFGIQSDISTIFAAAITITYSTFGGMKSVTFTDFIQSFTFLVVLPLFTIVIWTAYNNNIDISSRTMDPMFDISKFIDFGNTRFLESLLLFLLFAMPEFSPALFQRISAGKNVFQVKKAFTIAALVWISIIIMVSIITFCIHSLAPNLDVEGQPYAVMYHIIDNYTNQWSLIFLLIGIAAMTMSTADSYLNSSAIVLTHDIIYQLKEGVSEKQELLTTKIVNIILGTCGVMFALYSDNLLDMLFWGFKIEVVTIPFMMTVLGFRSSALSVAIGMGMSILTVILLDGGFIEIDYDIDSVVPAMFMNGLGMVAAHYILKQPGGWVGIKDKVALNTIQIEKKRRRTEFINSIKNFNLIDFCRKNSPENELTYTGFGIFSLISLIATTYSLSIDVSINSDMMFYYQIFLILTFSFISYPIWPHLIKKISYLNYYGIFLFSQYWLYLALSHY